MPDNVAVANTQASYTVASSVNTATTTNIEVKVTEINGTNFKFEFWADLVPNLLVQSDTIAVSGNAVAGDTVTITIVDEDTNTSEYMHEVQAGETFEQAVRNVVSKVNLDDDVNVVITAISATAFTATLTASSSTGKTYVMTVADTGTWTWGAPVSVTVGAAFASLKRRKVAEADIGFRVTAGGIPQICQALRFYDGAEVSPAIVSSVNELCTNHPSTLSLLANPTN